ncbi:hypothetical protein GF339_12740 [candidate division KSB3 bacterium]|uniref:Sulfotransferase domain-containing protein n=1 Tax=candidate division KSB3 bacterium TaxID=2044937 RepID=A0A9D5JWJ1_9BACT|nr:hypothetical protein [candidate division KSB3 bacterium]MBD3325450.1 hypothetical protein [candidate division KSB3 bacterium]
MNQSKNFVLTGMPRSGTTYLACVLYYPPHVITISEAKGCWKHGFQQHGKGTWFVQMFDEFRTNILQGKNVPTFEGTPGFLGHTRVDTWNQKKIMRRIEAHPDFALGMKNPEVFLELLESFSRAEIRCVITVRHPLFVINSWVKRGEQQVARGKSLEHTFANGKSVTYHSPLPDVVDRRIDLHNYFARHIIRYKHDPNIMLIRYEDWFTDPQQLSRVCHFLEIPSLGYLRPAPLLPDPLILARDEQARILRGCSIAEELGYPVKNHTLKAQNLPVRKPYL